MNKIIIDKGKEEEMRKKIETYFSDERDEELGELGSALILDFFIKNLGPTIYNQGIEDAQIYIRDKLDDLYALHINRD